MMDDWERDRIDPRHEYPADGLRRVDKHALDVLKHIAAAVTRTRDAIQLDERAPDGLTLLVTSEALELRLPGVEWTRGAYGPAAASRLWRRVVWDEIDDLGALIEAARQARRDEHGVCRFCGRPTPPEHRISKDVCQSCANTHLGVVF